MLIILGLLIVFLVGCNGGELPPAIDDGGNTIEEEVIEVKKCQQPPVRACYTECADLPSYPTYENEDCIE